MNMCYTHFLVNLTMLFEYRQKVYGVKIFNRILFTKYFKIVWGNENDTLILKKIRYNYN